MGENKYADGEISIYKLKSIKEGLKEDYISTIHRCYSNQNATLEFKKNMQLLFAISAADCASSVEIDHIDVARCIHYVTESYAFDDFYDKVYDSVRSLYNNIFEYSAAKCIRRHLQSDFFPEKMFFIYKEAVCKDALINLLNESFDSLPEDGSDFETASIRVNKDRVKEKRSQIADVCREVLTEAVLKRVKQIEREYSVVKEYEKHNKYGPNEKYRIIERKYPDGRKEYFIQRYSVISWSTLKEKTEIKFSMLKDAINYKSIGRQS
jgi:hypothetical protein